MYLITAIFFVSACGNKKESGDNNEPDTPVTEQTVAETLPDSPAPQKTENPDEKSSGHVIQKQSYAITTLAELPECNKQILKQLIYVQDEQVFKVCETTGWADIQFKDEEENTDEEKVPLIKRTRILPPITTDFCTAYEAEFCYFLGGQFVEFYDGSIFITGVWEYGAVDIGDTDLDRTPFSILMPPDAEVTWQVLHRFVARVDDYRSVFLVYDRLGDIFILRFDSNKNLQPDKSDYQLDYFLGSSLD